jgi:hypothetical protein
VEVSKKIICKREGEGKGKERKGKERKGKGSHA